MSNPGAAITSTTAYVGGGGALAKMGNATTDVIGFYGVTGTAQRTAAAQTTIVATFVTISSGFGFTTSAGVISIIATVQEIQATLTLLGLWKGS